MPMTEEDPVALVDIVAARAAPYPGDQAHEWVRFARLVGRYLYRAQPAVHRAKWTMIA